MGRFSSLAQAVKCLATRRSGSSSMLVLNPSARAFLATLKIDGLDEPSASGGTAVLTLIMPALIASRQQSVPSPVVQWVCSSMVVLPAASSTAGASVLVRSGGRGPPGVSEIL